MSLYQLQKLIYDVTAIRSGEMLTEPTKPDFSPATS